jgi:hypothetical protein
VVPRPAGAPLGTGAAHAPQVSEAATEELWRVGLGADLRREGQAVSGSRGPAIEAPTEPREDREPDLALPGAPEPEEPASVAEVERALPPRRSATRPTRPVERTRGEAEQVSPESGGVTAAELVAEVIADEELRSLRQGEGASSGESDVAVDVFADSLRALEHPRATNHVGMAPEVTILPRDDDEPERPPRKPPWGALAAVGLVLAVAVAGYLAREPIARLLVPESPPGGPTVGDSLAEVPGVESPTPDAAVVVGTPAAPVAESTVALEPSPTTPAEPLPVEPTPVPPTPTAAPTFAPRPASPAGRVEDIRWAEVGGDTVVTIVADGALSEDRVRVGTMADPPRVLVRLIRVDRYPRFELPVGTQELERIRVGHHPEQSPPSLHVVLDLAGPGVRLETTEVAGAEVRLTLKR